MAVRAESVDFEPTRAEHELCLGVATVGADLLPVVTVAAELHVRPDGEPARPVERGGEVDHPASRIPVQHRTGTANDLDAPHRPQIDVARLRGAVGGSDWNPVLDDGDAAQTEPRLRRPNADADAARQAVVPAILHEQPGNATQRLIERCAALRELDLVPLYHRDRIRHDRQGLFGAGHGDRFCERRDL